MKLIQLLISAFAVASIPVASASAQEVLILCKKDDPRSVSICNMNPQMITMCQDTYRINEAKRLLTEVDPGQILPPYDVEQWSETTISLKQETHTLDPKVKEVIRTRFDRISGRMIVYSDFIWISSGIKLTNKELDALADYLFKAVSILASVNRTTVTAECKVVKAAF
jgi:hypothetical protein